MKCHLTVCASFYYSEPVLNLMNFVDTDKFKGQYKDSTIYRKTIIMSAKYNYMGNWGKNVVLTTYTECFFRNRKQTTAH